MTKAAVSERRAKLLEEVFDYVLSNGPAGLSLRPLAAGVNTSPRMLLYFFGSKERLISEALAEIHVREQLDFAREMESEYEYWMDGAAFLRDGQAYRRVVRLADGTVLNRYWDDRAVPRDESYREDVKTSLGYRGDPGDVYRNFRAAAESGWDSALDGSPGQ